MARKLQEEEEREQKLEETRRDEELRLQQDEEIARRMQFEHESDPSPQVVMPTRPLFSRFGNLGGLAPLHNHRHLDPFPSMSLIDEDSDDDDPRPLFDEPDPFPSIFNSIPHHTIFEDGPAPFIFGGIPPFMIDGMQSMPIGMSYENLLNLQPVQTPAKNLDQLPEYKFTKTEPKSNDAPPVIQDCSICLTEFSTGESVKSLPCAHQFHSECINKWLQAHNTCPVCKTKVD